MRPSRKKTAKDPLEQVKLETAKVRLAKLEAELPASVTDSDLRRYEDYAKLKPLHPNDRDRLKQDLINALTACEEEARREKHEWYMSIAHLAP